jgi:hypothetical protein
MPAGRQQRATGLLPEEAEEETGEDTDQAEGAEEC